MSNVIETESKDQSFQAVDDTQIDLKNLDGKPRLRGAQLWIWRIAVGVVLIGLWQALAGRLFPEYSTSNPDMVARTLAHWAWSSYLWTNLWQTLHVMLIGLVLGIVAGSAIGITLGMAARAFAVLDPYFVALNALPKIAIAPLFILWFGIGAEMKILFVSSVVFFLVMWNVLSGVRSADTELVDVVRVIGTTRRQLLRVVFLPTAAEWIFTSLKIALPFALVGAVVAEMLSSNSGMGYIILSASSNFQPAALMAGLFVLMILSMLLNGLLALVERRVLAWKE